MSAGTRRTLSFLALAVAAGLLFVANGVGFFDRNVTDSSAFANHATSALEKGAVRRELVREIVKRAEGRAPELSARRAEVEAAAEQMVATPKFQSIFRAGVLEIHRFAFDDRDTQLLLDLRDLDGPLARAAMRVDPALAAKIPAGFDARVGEVSEEVDRTLNDAREFSERAGGLAGITLVAGLVLLALSLALAPDRFRALIRIGWLMFALGLIYVIAYYLVRALVVSELENDVSEDAVKGAWDGLIGGLRDFNLALLVAGLVVVIGTVLVRGRLHPHDSQGWEDESPNRRW